MFTLTEYPTVGTLKERSYFHDVHVPINATVSYTSGGTTTATGALYVYVIAYDAFGSLPTDNIASYAYSTRMRYSDA
jgi:hypothetical protein